jgi:hypothetical protein
MDIHFKEQNYFKGKCDPRHKQFKEEKKVPKKEKG